MREETPPPPLKRAKKNGGKIENGKRTVSESKNGRGATPDALDHSEKRGGVNSLVEKKRVKLNIVIFP